MELMLGLWLAASPFVLRYGAHETGLWIHDFAVASAVVAIALAAHWKPLRRLHLLLLGVAGWLVGAGWWRTFEAGGLHPHAAYQNWILVGLCLAMFAMVPSRASVPPEGWRRDSA
jgi:hypothetical protein